MIALHTGSPTLDRFARDLESEAPRSLGGLAPQLDGAGPDDVAAAWLGWASRIVDEHRSVIVFTELLGLLATLGAPFPALAAVQRLIGDELRHVKLCADLASAFGPLDRLVIDLDDLGLPPRGSETPGARALRIVVRELVVGEGESLAVLRAYRDAATDPACREALSLVLMDEARHHAVGRHLEALLRRTLSPADLESTADLAQVALADAAHIRAAHRAGATGGPGRRFGVSIHLSEAPPPLAALLAA
jgi:hypothetical protein